MNSYRMVGLSSWGLLKLKTEKFEKELAFKETRKSAAGQMVTDA